LTDKKSSKEMIKMPAFYISDLHIGHKNVIRHDVYIQGDFAWKNPVGAEMLSQRKGKKYLILGNNENYDLFNTFPEENWGR